MSRKSRAWIAGKNEAALRFVAGHLEARGFSPSMADIAEGIGASRKSKCTALEALNELEMQGRLRRLPNRARAIEILAPVAIPRGPSGEPLYFVAVKHG